MFVECLLSLMVLGQCPPVFVEPCLPICQVPIYQEPCPIEHRICNLNEAERSRFYVQVRLIDGQSSFQMSIPVINGITPTVTPLSNHTVFVLDYAKKTSRSTEYDGRIIEFSPITRSRPQPQRRRLIDLPPPSPRVRPQPRRAGAPLPLAPIPRVESSIQDRMQRPSDIQ